MAVFKKRSIITHYALFSVLFNIIPFLCFGFIIYYASGRILTNQIDVATTMTQKQLAMNIDSNIQSINHIADLFRSNENLKLLLQESQTHNPDRIEDINAIIRQYLIESKYPIQLLLIDKNGHVFENSDFYTQKRSARMSSSILSADWFSALFKLKSSIFWIGKNKNIDYESDPVYMYYLGSNIFSEKGYLGTLLVGVFDYFFSKQMNNLKPSQGSRVFLVDETGDVIIASEDSVMEVDGKGGDTVGRDDPDRSHFLVCEEPLDNFGFTIRTEIPKFEILQKLYFIRNITLVMLLLNSILLYLSINIIRRAIVLPIIRLSGIMKDSSHTATFPYDGPIDELEILINGLNSMMTTINNNILVMKRDAVEKKELEFKFLQSQIKPHFLYNTLNCIKWMAEIKSEKSIVRAITSLVKVIDYSMNVQGSFVSLAEEIDFVRGYIHLMNLRFANSITFKSSVDPSLLAYRILKLSLQPIVENSVLHGFSRSSENNRIEVTAALDGGHFVVSVIDNGKGMNSEKIEMLREDMYFRKNRDGHEGIGLANIYSRLKLEFGPEAELDIRSGVGCGTTVSLLFPKTKGGQADGEAYETADN